MATAAAHPAIARPAPACTDRFTWATVGTEAHLRHDLGRAHAKLACTIRDHSRANPDKAARALLRRARAIERQLEGLLNGEGG